MITQALILVGGKASRLRAAAVDVPMSKSFHIAAGKPLLHWSLGALYAAGIRRLIIAAEQPRLLHAAEKVVRAHPCRFDRVVYFQDLGNGVHGLPYELRYLLDEVFLFECGHSIQRPEHYRQLMQAAHSRRIVFSAYRPHPDTPRQPVALHGNKVRGLNPNGGWVIAHPIAAHNAYAAGLIEHGFAITGIISHHARQGTLWCIPSTMPAEYDIPAEMTEAIHIYEHYIAESATL